jgi:phage shock protein PspC (stress-responsive transcriptional regulator)
MRKELRLSMRDKKLFGVCGGWADYLNMNVTIIRLVSVVLLFISSGFFVVIYLIAALITPKEKRSLFDDMVDDDVFGWPGGGKKGDLSGNYMKESNHTVLLKQMELLHSRLDRIEDEIQTLQQKG